MIHSSDKMPTLGELPKCPVTDNGKSHVAACELGPKSGHTGLDSLPPLSSAPSPQLHTSNESSMLQAHEALSIMAEIIYRHAQRERFFSRKPDIWNGVALRLEKRQYVPFPPEDPRMAPWLESLAWLNCLAALTITSTVVAGITCTLRRGTTEIVLSPVDRIQVLEGMEDLAQARKAQGAAFVRSEGRLIIWTDNMQDLLTASRSMEAKMINYFRHMAADTESIAFFADSVCVATECSVKEPNALKDSHRAPGGEKLLTIEMLDSDTESLKFATLQERTTPLLAPLHRGLSLACNILLLSQLPRKVIQEALVDGNWCRLALVLACAPLFFVTMFFIDNFVGGLFQLLGPIRQMSVNSRYYSAVAPERITSTLPHITIQIPVYKEDLNSVLIPTFESVSRAIRSYKLQGGTASIVVSEDGLLILEEVQKQQRLDYYDLNQIAFVARPGHNVDGFVRRGRFKKASNLNFTCLVSIRIEEIMRARRPSQREKWCSHDEGRLYKEALQEALRSAHRLAQGSGNVRFGEYILLLDCDTRVPEDCLLDAASELNQCPDVAILQHSSGVMQVTKNNYFESGIAFFTRCVNFAISWVVANGDIAPFMGHNAFLRWSALQEVAFYDTENDNALTIWAENTVSEDFEMALRLLSNDYTVRWATYTNNGFLEGVSLTYGDELNRWQKYAFGVSELVFNPFRQWAQKGPITPLFRKFVWSRGIPMHYKYCASSYIFSYYAIAYSLPLSVGLSLAQGWFAPELDAAFLTPFKVMVAILVVFVGLGFIAQVTAKYRSKNSKAAAAMREHLVWLPFLALFFTSLSYHVFTALYSHLFGLGMSWGSTNKSLDDSNFFMEIPRMTRSHWKQLLLTLLIIAALVVSESPALPLGWQLNGGFTVVFPPMWVASAHVLAHLILNPQLLRFSF